MEKSTFEEEKVIPSEEKAEKIYRFDLNNLRNKSFTAEKKKICEAMELLLKMGYMNFDKQLPFASICFDNHERLVALVSGEKPTELESYMLRLEAKAFSQDVRDKMKALGELGQLGFEKNANLVMQNR